MSVTRFRLRGVPEGRLDLSVLTPQRLAGMDEAAVGRLVLAAGRGAPSVGDLFAMSAGEADAVVIEGGSALLDRVGAGMEGGSLVLEGDAGALRAGPAPGERAGMDGGVVLVRGSAGAQAGDRLRRGLVVVEGDAGEHAGSRMVAGTLVVCGRAGASPGAMLRRGTVVLGHAVAAPDGFLPSGRTPGVVQRLLAASLRAHSPAAAEAAARARLRLLGDQAALGKGEMLLPG